MILMLRATPTIPFPTVSAPRFHSPMARAFPSCHPERSAAESNREAASNEVQTGSATEKFDKLRMTRGGKILPPIEPNRSVDGKGMI